jgi:hypothetical protein
MSINEIIKKIKGNKLGNEEWVNLDSNTSKIRGVFLKIKDLAPENKNQLFIAGLVILTGTASFGLGRLSAIQSQRVPLKIESEFGIFDSSTSLSENGDNLQDGEVVASKNGTKYHFPWCSGAKSISEANKVIFKSAEEAKAAGYSPASNCKGLK